MGVQDQRCVAIPQHPLEVSPDLSFRVEIHAVVVEDLRIAAGEMTQALLAQGVSTSEAEKFEREATACVFVSLAF